LLYDIVSDLILACDDVNMVELVLVICPFGSYHEVLLVCLSGLGVSLNVELDKPFLRAYCWYDFRSPLLNEYLVVLVNIEYDNLAFVPELLYKYSVVLIWT
jgi:hypothetical protein